MPCGALFAVDLYDLPPPMATSPFHTYLIRAPPLSPFSEIRRKEEAQWQRTDMSGSTA